MAENMIK